VAGFDDCKDTTAKGLVITVSKEEGNRRTKKEYEEFLHAEIIIDEIRPLRSSTHRKIVFLTVDE
jgi:hypothetical protein